MKIDSLRPDPEPDLISVLATVGLPLFVAWRIYVSGWSYIWFMLCLGVLELPFVVRWCCYLESKEAEENEAGTTTALPNNQAKEN